MSITEKQFAEMVRGTVHEGRYAPEREPLPPVEQLHPDGDSKQPPMPKKHKRSSRPVRSENIRETERLSGTINAVLPWAVGIRLVTSPVAWGLLLIIALHFILLSKVILAAMSMPFMAAYIIAREWGGIVLMVLGVAYALYLTAKPIVKK